ncbi:DUF2520 domain-containing protein [Rhodococcus kroppenstedtii]|uniref:DUF2520 domain-containing protein n=1 Tax=Rhodococcoides kroppenstedtii TaxID=293050 RepID=A0ABS7NT33_9NOCA|nr:DUF2520 domain-containing protein [Rhodococcus kroppenstedtii]MBY6321176.1 DUF2520 domain-containing protein [Rhodococcus kroppenstedtii]MBY6400405.1 DUF2520 domain-containing protein [Rhodococcus kroppenstedtii]
MSVGIVSAGRVGTALGEALDRVGHVVFGCSAVSDASLARARTRLPDAAVLPAAEVAARSELLVLAVPDAELPALVQGLARTGAVSPGTLVLHTSGANGVGVLAPLAGNGVVTMAVHPAMTFSGKPEDTERLSSACFGITAADEIGFAIAQSLVLEIGGEPVGVREDARTLYHAALAHGSNHLVTVVNDALDALRTALADTELTGQQPVESRPGGVAERVLAPLLSAALDNVLRSGPAALTGPVARGDADMVDAHLQALTALDDDLAAGYRALSLRSAQRTGATHIVDRLRRQS